jgi:hypothetical protein
MTLHDMICLAVILTCFLLGRHALCTHFTYDCFWLACIVQEWLSLAAFLCDANIPGLSKVTLATSWRSVLARYQIILQQEGWRDSMKAEQLLTSVSELTNMLLQIRAALPTEVAYSLHQQLHNLVVNLGWEAQTAFVLGPCVQNVLAARDGMSPEEWQQTVSAAAAVLPFAGELLRAVDKLGTSLQSPSEQHAHVASVACTKLRLVLEAALRAIVLLSPAVCEQAALQHLYAPPQRQPQRRKQTEPVKLLWSRLMAGQLMVVLEAAAKRDEVIKAVYSKEMHKWCEALKHTGNKAVHATKDGEVTIADANLGLWNLKQLLLALLQAPAGAFERAD